jgi:hypothetical protein
MQPLYVKVILVRGTARAIASSAFEHRYREAMGIFSRLSINLTLILNIDAGRCTGAGDRHPRRPSLLTSPRSLAARVVQKLLD